VTSRLVSYVSCDLGYFLEWLPVISLDPSTSFLLRCVCVYVSGRADVAVIEDVLGKRGKELHQRGIFIALYTQPLLEEYLSSLPAAWSQYLRVNYIRCARYKVAESIQIQICTMHPAAPKRYFVLDVDHVCLQNLNAALQAEGLADDSPILVAWNSQFFGDHDYPTSLRSGNARGFFCESNDNPAAIKHAKPYITVKAGFLGLSSQSRHSRLFVDLLSAFAYGGPGSLQMRMFHFYYADQLAIHMSLEAILKDCDNASFASIFKFIDLASSNICNLFDHRSCAIYMPKGNSSTPQGILQVHQAMGQ